MFRVDSAHGTTIILNDKCIYKRMDLLKGHQEAIDYGENPVKLWKKLSGSFKMCKNSGLL